MSNRVELLGRGNLERVPSPATPWAALRARYVRALVGTGAAAFVANADVDMAAAVAGDDAWPVVVGDSGHNACVTTSPYAWYARYVAQEAKRAGTTAAWIALARSLPVAALLRAGEIDRTVHLGNWLMSMNPPGAWSRATLDALTARLVEAHPRRAVLVRSVTPALDPDDARVLREAGYRFVRSRTVYLLDTRDGAYLRRNNVQIDLGSLKKTRYEIVGDATRLVPHADRFAELYRALYVDKYVRLNAQLTPSFFEWGMREGLLEARALVLDGCVEGFVAMIVREGVVYATAIGYRPDAPRHEGLYRLLVALLIREAAERGAVLHLGSGAARFKELRGARPADEYDAVFDAHLPLRRRLPWMWLEAATRGQRIDRVG